MTSLERAPTVQTLSFLALAICLACRATHDSESSLPEPSSTVRLNESNGSAILGEWAIESVDETDLWESATPYLTFEPDGSVRGNASVNSVLGSWSWAGDRLELSPLATTLMAGPPALMKLERSLVEAAERVDAARLVGEGELELFESGGSTLIRAYRVVDGPLTKLNGQVYYRERIALGPGHRVQVALLDMSRGATESTVLQVFEAAVDGQVPIPFDLSYHSAHVRSGRRCALRASIRDANGRLVWTTTEAHPIDSSTHTVELLVERVP